MLVLEIELYAKVHSKHEEKHDEAYQVGLTEHEWRTVRTMWTLARHRFMRLALW